MANLSTPLDRVLGAPAAKLLADTHQLATAGDLLRYYPRRYQNPFQLLGDKRPVLGEHVTFVASIAKVDLRTSQKNRKSTFLRVTLTDGANSIGATFFNGHKLKHVIKAGRRGLFSGVVGDYRGALQLTHPGYLMLPDAAFDDEDGSPSVIPVGRRISGSGDIADLARAVGTTVAEDGGGSDTVLDLSEFDRSQLPIYPAGKELQSWTIWRCVRQVLDVLDPVEDPMPPQILAEYGLCSLDHALRVIHLPEDEHEIETARARLRFDEAVSLQLLLAQRRREDAGRSAPPCTSTDGGVGAAFDAQLPFELTAGQRAVGVQLGDELAQGRPMNRLLQGEVGSGKTIVALRAMLQVVDAGHQCALLAPTEVLATQHARSLRAMLGPLATAGELGSPDHATRITLLTGSMSTAAKRAALLQIADGDAGIVVGTHALLQDNVSFFDLGLVVVDEQHRFGVEQRDALRGKGRDEVTPHLLVMTATPIPRTIAMTVFGDLEVSTLSELPRGRSPIVSSVVPGREKPAWIARAWARINEEVAAGRQAYVVCSRIGGDDGAGQDETDEDEAAGAPEPESKAPPTHAAVDVFERLGAGALAGVRTGLLHGRLPADEKDAVMAAFSAGEIDVLVCTTVVEVGVDVPNATVMVVVDADRFGVSQLHQLRGRVGRGGHQGLCIMISELSPGAQAFARLNAVAATNDGFALAELDLAQRREGDVLGAAQSGSAKTLRLLSLLDHAEIIERARAFATEVVDADPDLTGHPGLAEMVGSVLDEETTEFLEKS
ncbi:ATP-dependent DNA helicase RecG [Speluncibacter jeojiensis]|uniref:ATP-dependent DNA helicase RecG n=1 Tax=Speluncibacter jeojiensis TaxID=2710754 RepID=UPI00240FF49D|nr:ATP-dependent DNA helicase RecG [Rhodococcus sp. D2-41]